MTHWTETVLPKDACLAGVEYAKQFSSLDEAWVKCDNPFYMLWFINKQVNMLKWSNDSRKLINCVAECVFLALPVFKSKCYDSSEIRDCLAGCNDYVTGVSVDLSNLKTLAIKSMVDANNEVGAYANYTAYMVFTAIVAPGERAMTPLGVADTDRSYYIKAVNQLMLDASNIIHKYYPTPPASKA